MPAVTILQGQMVLTNLLASSAEGGQFSVLGPDETIGPDTPDWRAISMTVPDDRAVGGLLNGNQTVDVFVTASVNVLTDPRTASARRATTPTSRPRSPIRTSSSWPSPARSTC